ncbi:dTMP kinase [Allostreptomyces psammosilenae]|uniref:Thymidylate kinase n=1 Tax=Allostreptomyces psammosilenae TaxID=1892865 RepID=A0A852ZZN2_9ACTN|nr:dTMP kinase [Allostreptomyces psammosilenae]NYI07796.1 dTMP kinase [Allostreptomyces psammosilenae]
MRPRGLFVTVDGPGGVGKSTAATALADHLRALGHPAHATAEPSTGAIGRLTRDLADGLRGHALACLVAADRYDHLAREIRPVRAAGTTVVCDRYLASTLVLQRLDGVPVEYLLALNAAVDRPDLAVILTADPAEIGRRLTARGAHHRFERDPASTAREVEFYHDAAETLRRHDVPVEVIDVSVLTPSGVVAAIARAVLALRR